MAIESIPRIRSYVKLFYESKTQSATRYTAFKVIRTNIEIAITSFAADSSIAFKFSTEFNHVTGDTQQMFKGHVHSVSNVSAAKKTIIRKWISSATSDLAWRRN